MTNKVNIREILENAGADHNAPEGTQGWALAQVAACIARTDLALAGAIGALAQIKIEATESPSCDALRLQTIIEHVETALAHTSKVMA